MHLIIFFVFAGFCLAGAVNLLLQSHPINSALSLIVVMTSLAVLYLLLGAEFLAAAQVIVYAGAIMVLFTELLLPFEVTSVLILIAILGAVALARHGSGDPHGIEVPQGNRERTAAK